MTLNASLEAAWTDRLVCPKCAGNLRIERDGTPEARRLTCVACATSYPVRDNIPSFVEATGTAQAAEIPQRDLEASSYDGIFYAWETFLEVPPLITDLKLRHGDCVLEVGCGTGRVAREYINKVDRVYAVDFSIESLRRLRRFLELVPDSLKKLVLVHADACALPIRSGTFDAVLSAGMIQHLPTQDHRAKAIAEMGRALRPGGRFVAQARHWSSMHAFHDTRRDNPVVRSIANLFIGNASGSIDLHRTTVYADGTVSIYNTPADEMRDLVERAGVRVKRVVGRIHAYKGMQRLGQARPLVERILERTPGISLLGAQEVVAVGTKSD